MENNNPTKTKDDNHEKDSHGGMKVLDFALLLGQLKTTKRTGWVNHNVVLPESISDHMHRMCVLAALLPLETFENGVVITNNNYDDVNINNNDDDINKDKDKKDSHIIINNKRLKLNRDRAIKIAMVHDIAEAIVGDLTPDCGVSKQEKQQRELKAMDFISKNLMNNTSMGKELFQLWKEYEDNVTPEAKFVKDLDKVFSILFISFYVYICDVYM